MSELWEPICEPIPDESVVSILDQLVRVFKVLWCIMFDVSGIKQRKIQDICIVILLALK